MDTPSRMAGGASPTITPPSAWKSAALPSRMFYDETVMGSPVPIQESTALHRGDHAGAADDTSVLKLSDMSDFALSGSPPAALMEARDKDPGRLLSVAEPTPPFALTSRMTVRPSMKESADTHAVSDLMKFSSEQSKSSNSIKNLNSPASGSSTRVTSPGSETHAVSGILVELDHSGNAPNDHSGSRASSSGSIKSHGNSPINGNDNKGSRESTYTVQKSQLESGDTLAVNAENSLAAYLCENIPPNDLGNMFTANSLLIGLTASETSDECGRPSASPPLAKVSPVSSKADHSSIESHNQKEDSICSITITSVTDLPSSGKDVTSSNLEKRWHASSTSSGEDSTTLRSQTNTDSAASTTSLYSHSSHCSDIAKSTSDMEMLRRESAPATLDISSKMSGQVQGQKDPDHLSQSMPSQSFTMHSAFFDSLKAQLGKASCTQSPTSQSPAPQQPTDVNQQSVNVRGKSPIPSVSGPDACDHGQWRSHSTEFKEMALSLPNSDSECDSVMSELSESCRPNMPKSFLEAFRTTDKEKMMQAIIRRAASNSGSSTNRSDASVIIAANEQLLNSEQPSKVTKESTVVAFTEVKQVEPLSMPVKSAEKEAPKQWRQSKIPLRVQAAHAPPNVRPRGRSLTFDKTEQNVADTGSSMSQAESSTVQKSRDSFFDVTMAPVHLSCSESTTAQNKVSPAYDLSTTRPTQESLFNASDASISSLESSIRSNDYIHSNKSSKKHDKSANQSQQDSPSSSTLIVSEPHEIIEGHDKSEHLVTRTEPTEQLHTLTPLTSSIDWKGGPLASSSKLSCTPSQALGSETKQSKSPEVTDPLCSVTPLTSSADLRCGHVPGEPLACSSQMHCIPASTSEKEVTLSISTELPNTSLKSPSSTLTSSALERTNTELIPIKAQARQGGSSGTLDAISTIPSIAAFPTHRTQTVSDRSTEYCPVVRNDSRLSQEKTTPSSRYSDKSASEISLPVVHGSQGDLKSEISLKEEPIAQDIPIAATDSRRSRSIEDWLQDSQREQAKNMNKVSPEPLNYGDQTSLHTLIANGNNTTHACSTMDFSKQEGNTMYTLIAGQDTTLCTTIRTRPSLDGKGITPLAEISKVPEPVCVRLEMPTTISFPGHCLIGLTCETQLPIHNCTERWLKVALSTLECLVDGQPHKAECMSYTKHRIIKPHDTEHVALKLLAGIDGEHSFQIDIVASTVSDESKSILPFKCAVIVSATVEKPKIELVDNTDNILDFGSLPYGCLRKVPLTLVNRTCADLPLCLRILSDLTQRGSFTFTSSHFTSKEPLKVPNAGVVNLTLPSASNAADPTIIYIQYDTPTHQGTAESPEYIEGRMTINLQSTLAAEPLSTVKMVCLTGNATVQIPSKFHVMNLEARPGHLVEKEISVRNGGDIPIHISCGVSETKYFTIMPPTMHLRPADIAQAKLTFDSRPMMEAGITSGDSEIMFSIEPNGREFTIQATGKLPIPSAIPQRLTVSRSDQFTGRTKLTATQSIIRCGGVCPGKSRTISFRIRSMYEGEERLKLDISDPNFHLVKFVAGFEELGSSRELLLVHGEDFHVKIVFTPMRAGFYQSRLKVYCPNQRATIRLPLFGYGGTSQVSPSLEPVSEGRYTASAGVLDAVKRNILCQVTLLNSGHNEAFVHLEAFTDPSCSTAFNDRVVIQPSCLILSPSRQEKINVCMKVTERERVLCDRGTNIIATLRVTSVDEVLRQHLIKCEVKSPSGDKSVGKYLKAVNIGTLGHEFELPNDASDRNLFKMSLNHCTIDIIGDSPRSRSPFEVPSSISPVPEVYSHLSHKSLAKGTTDRLSQGEEGSLVAVGNPSEVDKTSSVLKKEFFIRSVTAGQAGACTVELKSLVSEGIVLWTLIETPKLFHKAPGTAELKPVTDLPSVFRASPIEGALSTHEKSLAKVTILTEKCGMFLQLYELHCTTLTVKHVVQIQIMAEVVPNTLCPTSLPNHASAFIEGVFIPQREVLFTSDKPGDEQTIKLSVHNRNCRSEEITVLKVLPPFSCRVKKAIIREKHVASLPISFKPKSAGEYTEVVVVVTGASRIYVQLKGSCGRLK